MIEFIYLSIWSIRKSLHVHPQGLENPTLIREKIKIIFFYLHKFMRPETLVRSQFWANDEDDDSSDEDLDSLDTVEYLREAAAAGF